MLSAIAFAFMALTLVVSTTKAQMQFHGCFDAAGHPVPPIPQPTLQDLAMATFAPEGTPVILYNPSLTRQDAGAAARFTLLHECAHHALGQLIHGARGELRAIAYADEQKADCAAIVYLVRTGEFNDDSISSVQHRFFDSPGNATHLPGPVRSTNLRACLEAGDVATAGSAAQPKHEDTYTARFRIHVWTRYERSAADFDLILTIDNEHVRSLGNLAPALVEGLAAGTHGFRVEHILYGQDGRVSRWSCFGTFRITGPRTFAIVVSQSRSGAVTCVVS